MTYLQSAGGVLVNRQGDKVYLIYQKERGDWQLPKGKIEPREAKIDTAQREIANETRRPGR